MRLSAHLPTTRPVPIMTTAARHFAHKVAVEQDEGSARIAFPGGTGVMTADAAGLALMIEAESAEAAERVRQVFEGHLLRFAHRESPKPLVWTEIQPAPPL
ncbi:DUF2218 domain-containing protein [Paracoccus contaminans]|nr:DUF2218 domain-containing protein [Paracoccus contaminans]